MTKRRESGGGKRAAEAFIEYAQPLLESPSGPMELEERAQMLTLAFAVWNAVVFERAGRRPRVLEGLRAALSEPAEREILKFMVDRKRNERPVDNRVVGDLEFVRGKGGEMDVRVSYAEYSSVVGDPKLERIEAHILAGFGVTRAQRGQSKRSAKKQTDAKRDSDSTTAEPPTLKTPAVDVASSEVAAWTALHQRADEFRELAPWSWMGDSEVFGVRLADDEIAHWCCILGASSELFGLAVYSGDAGYETQRQIQNDEDDAEEALYGSDGFLVVFRAREELSPLEIARVKAAKVRFKGPNAWPQFERTRYGRLPRTIDLEHVARLTALIERVLLVVSARRATPDLLAVDSGGALAVWSVAGEIVREAPKPPPPPSFPAVDEVAVERLRRTVKRSPAVCEYDVYPTEARVDDGAGGVFIPAVHALVDAESGVAHCCDLEPPERRHAMAVKRLLAAFESSGSIPAQVRVSRAWVRAAIKPTLDALEVRVAFGDELPALDEFRAAMDDALESGELGA